MMCVLVLYLCSGDHRDLHVLTHSFPTRRSSDLRAELRRRDVDRGVEIRPGPCIGKGAVYDEPAKLSHQTGFLGGGDEDVGRDLSAIGGAPPGKRLDAGEPAGDRIDDRLIGQRKLAFGRSEEHTSALQSLMRISYAVFFLKKKTTTPIPKG